MKKMKIALFSPFCSQNYGTVLQAFSLAKVLNSLGHECEYIDWCYYKQSKWNRLKFLLRHPLYVFYRNKNQKHRSKDLSYSFLKEDKYMSIISKNRIFCDKYTPHVKYKYPIDELSSLEKHYDKFIVGSDQTWSPNALYQYSPYYLSFIKDSSKKASYACSCGTTNLPSNFRTFLGLKLKSFDKLSCREQTNAASLTSLLNKDVNCVLDPTLLVNRENWSNYFLPVENMPKKYILCYILGEKKNISEYAEKLGREKSLPVYYILTRPTYENKQNVLQGVGCQEFLWLIDNCEYLVTDSFHGTIFALNFGRNFISFDKHPTETSYDNGRLLEILSAVQLESHYHIDSNEEMPAEIDYSKVSCVLAEKREKSLMYLRSLL